MTPDSLAQARRQIGAHGTSSLSCDIFDTFLLRRCTGPDGVYERCFELAPIPAACRGMVESFVQHRVLAEHKARYKKLMRQAGTEVTIGEIYEQFATHVFKLPNSARRILAETEFAAELELCFLNPDILDLVEEAQSLGLRVGFISDTYWSHGQLKQLLRNVAPNLNFDFLYASCDFGAGKNGGLLDTYLEIEALASTSAVHIGDNYAADVVAAEHLGIRAIHYPQAPKAMTAMIQREAATLQLMQSQRGGIGKRLDGGLQVMRRLVAGALQDGAELHHLVGATVLGPVMQGFQTFASQRVAELQAEGRRPVVLFLARDGHLPMQLWNAANAGEAYYVEINRRVALVGCSDNIEPIQDLFKLMRLVDEPSIANFLKEDIPSVSQYFSEQPGQITSGFAFASELPTLIGPEKMQELSCSMRERLIDYLHQTVEGFADCTDVVLVDLGYGGTIQHSLRGLFDLAGLEKNLHGLYLITVDDKFSDLRDGDSVRGYIDDSVLTPLSKRMLLRNISVLEQFCSAPVGSVHNYDGATALREDELRAAPQLEFCREIQQSCLRFATQYRELAERLDIDPLGDLETTRLWATVILSRFLLMPNGPEQELFGQMQHDVNLGSRTLIDLINAPELEVLMGTMPFANVCAIKEPPMWLAGSIAAVSTMAGYAYTLAGFSLLPSDVMSDIDAGRLEVTLIKANHGEVIPVSCMVTGFGDVRLRIPVLKKHTGSVIAVPLDRFLHNGVIRSLTLQQGDGSLDTLVSRGITMLPINEVRGLRARVSGSHFQALEEDAHILVTVPASDQPLSIVTMTVGPLPPVAA
jgi:FMN phosphatase YigB (HAD superfamily)